MTGWDQGADSGKKDTHLGTREQAWGLAEFPGLGVRKSENVAFMAYSTEPHTHTNPASSSWKIMTYNSWRALY